MNITSNGNLSYPPLPSKLSRPSLFNDAAHPLHNLPTDTLVHDIRIHGATQHTERQQQNQRGRRRPRKPAPIRPYRELHVSKLAAEIRGHDADGHEEEGKLGQE